MFSTGRCSNSGCSLPNISDCHKRPVLQEGFKAFGRQCHGFLTNEAVMIGVETRTSSPVRIVRNGDTLMHVRLEGLFPCGEGAGYAGGIVSAGVDGERCAEMCAQYHWLS